MASRVFHLSGLQLDQATSGSYYALIVWGTGLVRNTGEQPISGVKTFYDSAFFQSDLNVGGDFTLTGNVVGSLVPKVDNQYDLGSLANEWRNAYFDGTGWFDTVIVDENLTVTTGLSVGGNTLLSGDLHLGGSASLSGNASLSGDLLVGSNITVYGNLNTTGNFIVTGDFLPKNIAKSLIPKGTNLYDLGSQPLMFKNAYFSENVSANEFISNNTTVSGNIVGANITGNNIWATNDATVKQLFITGTGIPTTTGSAGLPGQIAVGSGYLYHCTGLNAWIRVQMSPW